MPQNPKAAAVADAPQAAAPSLDAMVAKQQPTNPPVSAPATRVSRPELSDAPKAEPSVYDSDKLITSGGKSGNGSSNADASAMQAATPTPPVLTPELKTGPKRIWHISCHPDTPVAHPELDVVAASREEAENLWFAANGISATHRERVITEVAASS